MTNQDKHTFHRFEVENDKFVWGNIRKEDKTIHLDFSENLGTNSSRMQPKMEPQSHHFSGKHVSLHCSLLETPLEDERFERKYIYHISDILTHNITFVNAVVEDSLNKYFANPDIIRRVTIVLYNTNVSLCFMQLDP